MPYAVTYLSDIKSGIIKNYVTRTAKFNYIVLKVKVQNESQDKFNMFSIVTDSNLVIYPDGYENQGMVCEDNVSVDKGSVFRLPAKHRLSQVLRFHNRYMQ
jgi:hypothetical protein